MVPRSGRTSVMTLVRAAAAVAIGALSVGIVGLAAVAGALPELTPAPVCTGTGPVAGLTAVQSQNARVIVAAVSTRAGYRGALIAVMTAMTESHLLVLGNPNDPTGSTLPNQGIGYDHDSLGLFQQRPGWGSAAQRMDPITSTTKFLDGLLAVPGWQQLDPWVAAQQVQRSAWTGTPTVTNGWSDVLGGNYLADAGRAAGVVANVLATAPDCGAGPTHARPAGLPARYALPINTSPAARVAVTFALAQLGRPYVWGAAGPAAYDCSGLTSAAWRVAGVTIGRTTSDQMRDGTASILQFLAPGDLILVPGSDGSLAAPGHVGMYVGDDRVVEAPQTGAVVRVVGLASYVSGGLSAIRHIA